MSDIAVKLTIAVLVVAQFFAGTAVADTSAGTDPAEVAIGERLFLETRFAQAYAAAPDRPDPVVATTVTTAQALPGPFAGASINCRACHLVDEQANDPRGGMRAYTDFARRSPIPARPDGRKAAARNAMSMVNIALPRAQGVLLHFDGEFASMEDLVRGTLTGRNFGWLPSEQAEAIAHIARVIRSDNGTGDLARELGGSYAKVLRGTDPSIPETLRLPEQYRIDVRKASDRQILDAVARLIAAYVGDLNYSRDAAGRYNGSPYDRFLENNGLPRTPRQGESNADYSHRLLARVEALESPVLVDGSDGRFAHHDQPFRFGARELEGMKLFFRPADGRQRGGNCVSCHTAPDFSDFGFHNTGVTQQRYDAVHGPGAFAALGIPGLDERNADYDAFLPPTPLHPTASGRFKAVPALHRPGVADLGLWNVFANPDFPAPQAKLHAMLCPSRDRIHGKKGCADPILLSRTVAAFKTPVLRDLGDSAPYMHDGGTDRLRDAVEVYVASSELARSGGLRNGAPELTHMRLAPDDIDAVVAFLRSLNEDYE
jgi:cytochrome c peroxidase